LLRSNFSFAIIYLLGLITPKIITVSLVIGADELLFLNQVGENPPIKLREVFRKPLAEDFKPAMPTPEISNPVPTFAN